MKPNKAFYFFSSQFATRFHIAKNLLAQGWYETRKESDAAFSDQNLMLNDEVSKYLEYKHLLAGVVEKYYPECMPLTYSINDENYEQVCAKIIYQHYLKHNCYQQNSRLKWILKPSMLNNGDEIKLFNDIAELQAHFRKKDRLGGDQVVQQYITNPDLLENRKYTFRVLAVVTNYAGIFFYRKGYVNISAYPFSLDNFENRKIHITNYVLDGEFAHIEQRLTDDIEDFPMIYQQMCMIVKKTMRGVLKISPDFLKPGAQKIFEIFGFDFILDQNKKLWLLEINQSPDAPTFEENALTEKLWKIFWQDIIDDFVLPIALHPHPHAQYQRFTQILSKKECYSFFRSKIHRLKKKLGFS